jgi:hypothetical protein
MLLHVGVQGHWANGRFREDFDLNDGTMEFSVSHTVHEKAKAGIVGARLCWLVWS